MESKEDKKEKKALKKQDKLIKKEERKKLKKLVAKNTPKKELKSISLEQETIVEVRNKRHILEAVIIIVIVLMLIVVLGNKSFLNTKYKNKSIDIEIPIFMYYVSDKDNIATFKTLRKSAYVRNYFDNYLDHLDYYFCNGNVIYYDSKTNSAIKDVIIDKYFTTKTVQIRYYDKSIDELCQVIE